MTDVAGVTGSNNFQVGAGWTSPRELSLESLVFLRNLLAAQQLNVSAPEFREVSVLVVGALDELDEAIAAAQPVSE